MHSTYTSCFSYSFKLNHGPHSLGFFVVPLQLHLLKIGIVQPQISLRFSYALKEASNGMYILHGVIQSTTSS